MERVIKSSPVRSCRADRQKEIRQIIDGIFKASAGCSRLAKVSHPHWVRLDEAVEYLDKAKSLLMQIAVLEIEHGQLPA